MSKYRDAAYRKDRSNDEKMIFFSAEAIDRAVSEGRLPADVASQLKKVLPETRRGSCGL